MKGYIERLKNFFSYLKKYNRLYALIILGFFIIVNIILLTKYVSFAYYHSNSEFKLINARVGNLYLEEYDYVQLIYLEEKDELGNGLNKYYLVDEIPVNGYIFSKYKCDNDSILLFDNKTNTVSVTTGIKDSCSIYMDVSYE